MSDLISRQAAIDVADAVWSVTGDKNVAKVWDQIKDLPSAQPDERMLHESCTDCPFTCGCHESTRYELPVDPEDTCVCFGAAIEEVVGDGNE